MLELRNITKEYQLDRESSVHALKGISLSLPDTGFISILGPSGCGKTTLLNIVSGLDRYTSGDLIVDGISTSKFSDRMWDDYRNKKVGMVFQSYNLIPHLTIWENVALPLTLAGFSRRSKKERALRALAVVGLKDQGKKHPNQLSGGQQQRIAIARAIINNPSIILADEPTGALDSVTSVQVMDILKSLSKKRLVVMVTHNRELALRYSDRIISMKDGLVISDAPNSSDLPTQPKSARFQSALARRGGASRRTRVALAARPLPAKEEPVYIADVSIPDIDQGEPGDQRGEKRSRMTFWTAFSMSVRNLLTKKGRTILTAIASSFGIIGVGLVLAVSNGFTHYINRMESESLAQFPITISSQTISLVSDAFPDRDLTEYPEDGIVHVTPEISSYFHVNNLTPEYYDTYLSGLDPDLYNSIKLSYSTAANVVTSDGDGGYCAIDTVPSSGILESLMGGSSWQELPGDEDFIMSQYDLVEGEYPQDETGLLIVVDSYNSISADTLAGLGYDPDFFPAGTITDLTFEDISSKTYRLFDNDDFYAVSDEVNGDVRGLALLDPDDYYTFITLLSQLVDASQMSTDELLEIAQQILSLFVQVAPDFDAASLLPVLSTLRQFTSGTLSWDDCLATIFTQLQAAGVDINPVTEMRSYERPRDNSVEMRNLYEYGNREGVAGDDRATDLHVVGILRPKPSTTLGILSDGIYYTSPLSEKVAHEAENSQIAQDCGARTMIDLGVLTDEEAREIISSLTGGDTSAALADLASRGFLLSNYSIFDAFSQVDESTIMAERGEVGTDSGVSSITIYPVGFDAKDEILTYLDAYNVGKDEADQIIYTDVAGTITVAVGTIIDVISTVLIVFASISMVVSSVMIGIIIYVSVIERTKEIGTLRSVGARKKDVARLFIMESVSIGILAGVLGVLCTYLLSIPINAILNSIFASYELGAIASLNPLHGLILIAISALLTFVAGLIPARIAGRKDPVLCLRTE